MVDDICWRKLKLGVDMVYKNGIHAGIDGALYISILVVADHDAFFKCGAGFFQSVIENFFFWFEAVACFGRDNLCKIFSNAAEVYFFPLRLLETVSNKMKFVLFRG